MEQVFAYPGIGRLLTLSIRDSDFNLLGGVVFIIIVGVSLATLILDLTYPCWTRESEGSGLIRSTRSSIRSRAQAASSKVS